MRDPVQMSVADALVDIGHQIDHGEFDTDDPNQPFDWWTLREVIAMQIQEPVAQALREAERTFTTEEDR